MIDKRERGYQEFREFLVDFILDLNRSAEDGWTVLVEGRRDEKALRGLGYAGKAVTVSRLGKRPRGEIRGIKRAIILTDLDVEGNFLASKFFKMFRHEGAETSLGERRRLRAASRGVFLQVENLSRFAKPEGFRWDAT